MGHDLHQTNGPSLCKTANAPKRQGAGNSVQTCLNLSLGCVVLASVPIFLLIQTSHSLGGRSSHLLSFFYSLSCSYSLSNRFLRPRSLFASIGQFLLASLLVKVTGSPHSFRCPPTSTPLRNILRRVISASSAVDCIGLAFVSVFIHSFAL